MDEQAKQVMKPLLDEFDRIERLYGFDRPDHQGQILVLTMLDVKRIKAALIDE